MARRALYREYRPETFSEVIGQDHITTILKNQVREGKLSHAYLFCGSRGTGKTTSAKILARAANCLEPKDGEPCGRCAACRLTAAGSADVIEIDAASNNSVDNVRSLIEQAQFAPLELKYRVFIIDEVHMLSNAAFNALLKTLEEPPKHVLFILATTEPQKLPATIISRCQRFDFHRLTIAHIVTNLTAVLEKAGASIEPNGLRLIARAAEGGMRDALSLADQCLSYAGNRVTEQDVLDALGTVSAAVLEDTANALLSGNAKDAVRALDDVVKNGRDLGVFLNDLSRHFRALLLAKTCGDCADLLDCTDDQMQRYLKTAKAADEARILYAMEQLLSVQGRLRLFPAPRVPIETAFVRICRPADDQSFSALEARVALLEARPAGTTLPSFSDGKDASSYTGETRRDVPHDAPVPPWEEPPMREEPPAKEPAPESAPTQEPEPTPAPAPVEKPQSSEAETIWEAAKKKIMELNPMVYFYVKGTTGTAINGDVLTVEFPATQESMLMGLRAARNLKIANDAIATVRPGTELSFRLAALQNENEEKLKELFGSSLVIK
ncbi:MAG: DNA polymerase III subunit gamma/tau [Clostridia bacterium]|nr:DNA polymerase III subunit gamma/tau [Clostridia bacterium]